MNFIKLTKQISFTYKYQVSQHVFQYLKDSQYLSRTMRGWCSIMVNSDAHHRTEQGSVPSLSRNAKLHQNESMSKMHSTAFTCLRNVIKA